jgi:hypothetical protein
MSHQLCLSRNTFRQETSVSNGNQERLPLGGHKAGMCGELVVTPVSNNDSSLAVDSRNVATRPLGKMEGAADGTVGSRLWPSKRGYWR